MAIVIKGNNNSINYYLKYDESIFIKKYKLSTDTNTVN